MKKSAILPVILAAAALWVSTAVGQQKMDYNSFGKDQQDVQKLEAQWADALLNGRAAVLQEILADNYAAVDPSGKTVPKATEVATVQSGQLKLNSLTVSGVALKVYVGAAVVTGTLNIKGKVGTTDVSGEYRYTDIFETQNNSWKA